MPLGRARAANREKLKNYCRNEMKKKTIKRGPATGHLPFIFAAYSFVVFLGFPSFFSSKIHSINKCFPFGNSQFRLLFIVSRCVCVCMFVCVFLERIEEIVQANAFISFYFH